LKTQLAQGRAHAPERSEVVSPAALRKAGVGGSIPSLATTLLKTQLARGRAHALERSEVVPPAANDMRRMLLVGRDR